MDFCVTERDSIRSKALIKLVQFSLSEERSVTDDDFKKNVTLDKITAGVRSGKNRDVSHVPMTKKEFEILTCLADSCQFISDIHQAEYIYDKLKIYFMEVFKQAFTDGVISSINPNPWDFLTRKLTDGLCWIAAKFPDLSQSIVELFHTYLDELTTYSNKNHNTPEEMDHELSKNFFSFYGFILGLTESRNFFTTADVGCSTVLKIVSMTKANNFLFLQKLELLSQNSRSVYLTNYRKPDAEFSSVFVILAIQRLIASIYSAFCGNVSSTRSVTDFLLEKSADKFEQQQEDDLNSQISINDDIAAHNGNGTAVMDVVDDEYVKISDKMISKDSLQFSQAQKSVIMTLTSYSFEVIDAIDQGCEYINLTTSQRIETCYAAKAVALHNLAPSIYQEYMSTEDEGLNKAIVGGLSHPRGMNNYPLSTAVVTLSSLIIHKNPECSLTTTLIRVYSVLISTPELPAEIAMDTARPLSLALKVLPQDVAVTTLYAIINLISTSGDGTPIKPRPPKSAGTFDSTMNVSSLSINSTTDSPVAVSDLNSTCDHIFRNAINVVVTIVKLYNDSDITTLVVTMFSQKIEQSAYLVPLLTDGLARCSPYCQDREFASFNRLFSDLVDRGRKKRIPQFLTAVTAARIKISELLLAEPDNKLYSVYLNLLLRGVTSRGDVQKTEQHHRSHSEISEVAHDIAQFLKPLAALLPDCMSPAKEFEDPKTVDLFKNMWYNLVVHGYALDSDLGKNFEPELMRIAHNSPPLASEKSWNRTETSLELNAVLRRGSSNSNIKFQRDFVDKLFGTSTIELRTLSTSKVMFLSAAAFLESLRVKCGDFSTVLLYFSDPTIKISGVERFMGSLSVNMTHKYLHQVLASNAPPYKIDNIANQLQNILILCCHRDFDLQDTAFQCCDIFIKRIPSSLCHHISLFALLDLLTLLYQSIIDADTNVYDPKFIYELPTSNITITLSDSIQWRHATLKKFYEKATSWVNLALLKCSMDLKALFQSYIPKSSHRNRLAKPIELGISFAFEMGSSIIDSDKELSNVPANGHFKEVNTMSNFFSNWSNSYTDDLLKRIREHVGDSTSLSQTVQEDLEKLEKDIENHVHISDQYLTETMERCAGLAVLSEHRTGAFIRFMVSIPFSIFTASVFKLAIRLWMTLIKERPDYATLLLANVVYQWEKSIEQHRGLFSKRHDLKNPEFSLMEYAPSDKEEVARQLSVASHGFHPHLQVVYFFQSHLEATMYQSDYILKMFTRAILAALHKMNHASCHPFARLVRFEIILLGLTLNKLNNHGFTELLLDASLDFFKARARFPHGSNKLKIKTDYDLLVNVANSFKFLAAPKHAEFKRILLLTFLDDEINRIGCFLNPLIPIETLGKYSTVEVTEKLAAQAYHLHPSLAFNLTRRYNIPSSKNLIVSLLAQDPLKSYDCPESIGYVINPAVAIKSNYKLLFYKALCVPDAINFLITKSSDPIATQLSVRSLSQDISISFFYVPQIVQALRYDKGGYVERFILETAKVSQLFAHQIIWNMNANKFLGDEGDIEDSLKPTLDAVQKKITSSLSDEDLDFYEREFAFFDEVTGISGKLKPYIKKTKAEKKAKIDEEMAQIQVLKDVYLPSNPDGVVIDINRKSGKPLQSHAKAPFMATFRIKKEVKTHELDEEENDTQSLRSTHTVSKSKELWLSAIFKVGDDCRQDVLTLQLISVFRTIWMNAGLDLYVFPYRVTATAPGCGVIDVLPNSISRDMLGREAVNGLYQYFITKFGPESSVEFQHARNNFVKSLAAYSVVSYIFQFKDRHNGNIMYDDQGHILHIDFGFIFDIVPGGVKFEQSPFKLTKEMVDVMGGHTGTQAFKWFEELCVKGFLTVRPHMETIVGCIAPMLDSGLPCFKPSTISNLRRRFVPSKSEKDAAAHMRKLIRKSCESLATKGYDEFQRLTNGIPY